MLWAEAVIVLCAASWLATMVGIGIAARRAGHRVLGSLIWASMLFVDPAVLGLGVVVGFGAGLSALMACVTMLFAARKQDRKAVTAHALRFAAFVATGILGLMAVRQGFDVAEQRAARVVAAVQAYRATHGSLPPSLPALVPRFLSEIPAPRLLLSHERYVYAPKSSELTYVLGPMMGRVHDFEADSWRPLDD